jgi:Zn-finger nucleic acid-binding protein
MNCPNDGTTLQMTDRQGIEIDYCPQCRGVWLDRGELDKIIERSSAVPATAAARVSSPSRQFDDDDEDDRDDDRERYGREGYPRKKRKSLLGELFDF